MPLAEYLATNYEPDLDYDGGRLIERNVGKWKHSRLQLLIAAYLANHEAQWGIIAFTEQRIRVSAEKYCVADVCAVPDGARYHPVLESPPLLTIEILSEGDTFSEVHEKARKYLDMGIRHVWTVDPETGACYRHSADGMASVPDAAFRVDGSPIAIPIAELLANLKA